MCYFSFLWWRAPVGIPVITLFAVLCFSVLVIGIQSLGPNLSHLPVFKSTRTIYIVLNIKVFGIQVL